MTDQNDRFNEATYSCSVCGQPISGGSICGNCMFKGSYLDANRRPEGHAEVHEPGLPWHKVPGVRVGQRLCVAVDQARPSGVLTKHIPITGEVIDDDPLTVVRYGPGPLSCANCGSEAGDPFDGHINEVEAIVVCCWGCSALLAEREARQAKRVKCGHDDCQRMADWLAPYQEMAKEWTVGLSAVSGSVIGRFMTQEEAADFISRMPDGRGHGRYYLDGPEASEPDSVAGDEEGPDSLDWIDGFIRPKR